MSPMISVVSWAAGPTSAPVIPKTFHNPGTAFSGGGGSSSGSGSAFFDGTGDSLDVGTFTIGTDAFTIENWFQPKFNTNGSDTVFLYDVSSEDIRVTFKNGNIRAQLGSETELSYSIGTLDYNTWYYTALQRDSSGNVNFYFDGAVVGNYSASGQNVSGNTLRIGDKQAGSKEFHGYISNFRIVRGNALYPPANGGSTSFDGTGDYIDTTNPLSGTGDFTMEGWIYPTSSGTYDGYFSTCQVNGASGGIVVAKDKFFVTHGGGSSQIGFSDTIENNVWSHIALQRSSNVFSLYKDGILQGTATVTVSLTGSALRLASRYMNDNTYQLNGFLSNFRIVDGTPYFPGGGSTYFDGTDDLLKISDNTSFRLGTGDFTIECWVYFTDTSLESGSNRRIFNLHETGNAVDNLQIVIDNGGYRKAGDLFLYSNSIQGYLDTDIRSGWHHIAVVRNSGTLKFYLDGVSKYSASNTQDYSPGGVGGPRPTIGSRGDDKGDYKGNISNFRMVVGTAVYTSNFTPSTSALTDITNTQLLTCQNSTGAITDNSSNSHVVNTFGGVIASGSNPFNSNTNFTVPTSPLTAISGTQLLTCQNGTGSITDASSNNYTINDYGDASASGSSPFAKSNTPLTDITNTKLLTCNTPSGTITDASSNNHTVTTNGDTVASGKNPFSLIGSTYFDGTGDYLTISNSQNFYSLGTADWTIEFWVYFTDISTFRGVFQIGEDVGALSAMLYTDGKLKLLENDQAIVFESNQTFSANTWYHIVYTNDDASNTQRLWINGIAQSNTGSKSTAYSFGNKTVYIGGRYFSGSFQRDMNGYISNFRIVGGSVVYPPASGGGSAYFDGAGDYTLTATNSNLTIGSNNFTAECWIHPTTFATVQNVIDRRRSGDTSSYDWTTYLTTSGEYAFYANGSTRITSSALTVNKWYHTAVVRNINTGLTTLYIDGVSQGTYSDSNVYPSNQLTFGMYGPALPGSESLPYTGYISNFRLIIGTAANNAVQYGSNFTVPTSPLTKTFHTEFMTFQNYTGSISDESNNGISITANGDVSASLSSPFIESKSPLTAITNTQLLTCQNSSGTITDASSNGYTLTANGNAQPSHDNPFYS